jgi:DNA repair exonuclease SbcCD ATPase subunit
MCHDKSYIDFTQFSSALIIGNKEQNELHANGVGKTTIFKAIEYVLFNQSDVTLEHIIRDDTDYCHVIIDFLIKDQEFRISRKRTRKGNSDVSLLEKNATPSLHMEAYHLEGDKLPNPNLDKETLKKYWKDLSGSRAGDTEKEVAKLIKINPKSFRSTIHFLQNDVSGLSTATPEKRKGILKDAFNLLIYSKLEKIAKEQSNLLSKEIDKNNTLLSTLGNPEQDINTITGQLAQSSTLLVEKQSNLSQIEEVISQCNNNITSWLSACSNLENKCADLIAQEKLATQTKNKLEISVKEYQSKKSNSAKIAKELLSEIEDLKATQLKLIALDYSQIEILSAKIVEANQQITEHNISIKNYLEKIEDYRIPLPEGNICKSCRKPMSVTEKEEHQQHINQELLLCQKQIQESKAIINNFNKQISSYQQQINSLTTAKKQLENLNERISSKNKEVSDKKALYDEYSVFLKKFSLELEEKNEELSKINQELANSSMDEVKSLQNKIELEKQKIKGLQDQIGSLNKEITHYSNSRAVLQHTLEQRNKDKILYQELTTKQEELNKKFSVYPLVVQGFSSIGIPNLIIQNILNDLQAETNNLLAQLKPGGKEIQLSFSIEKKIEKTGDQADTLDINYVINGKNRYYEQLSGAQQIAVMFSLKLGLSFLLQKMIGADIRMLLLDEIDQSLDKASVDEYANIIKFFQKDFTILIITHNDRLKDKFSHAILVEQDINMISTARVVSSWQG